MSSEISTARSAWSGRSGSSSSSASGRLQSLLTSNHHSPVQLSVRYSSSLEHASHQKDRGLRRSATSSTLERLTPRQFLDKYSLPRVVRVVTPGGGDGGDREGDVEQRRMLLGPLAEPLLLYRQYKSVKVQARSVQSAKTWSTVGPPLVLPDSYQGWFSLLTSKGQPVAHCYSTIQQLIAAQITRFLSKTDLTAYKLGDNKDLIHESVRRRLQYMKTVIQAGQTLKLLAVFEDVSGTHSGGLNNKRLSLPLVGRNQNNTRYAQCLTYRNQVVFVPLSTTGQFFAVSLSGAAVDADNCPLYLLPQLLRDNRLPVRVQLVSGPLPVPLPLGFTGVLLLEAYQEEDVILACTLPPDAIHPNKTGTGSSPVGNSSSVRSPEPKLLEMDADSRFFLSRPLFHHEFESRLFKSPLLQTALTFCRDRGDFWRRQIKVTHHIFPSHREAIAEVAGKKSTTQREPTREGQEKTSKTKNKSRRTTKKSSSFTYTPSSSKGSNLTRDLSLTPCNYKTAGCQQRTEVGTREAGDTETPLNSVAPPPICRHKNESRLHHQGPYTDLREPEVDSKATSQLYSGMQNRDLPSIIIPCVDDLPYSHVADAIEHIDKCEEENIYAEICELDTKENNRSEVKYYYLKRNSGRVRDDCYYVELGGGSDGTFSGTLSSSNPSSRDEDTNYDAVC